VKKEVKTESAETQAISVPAPAQESIVPTKVETSVE
jgi:hypothetical protein